jgi:hypothetical protein
LNIQQKTNRLMTTLKLDTIGKDIEGISQTFGAYMAECAAVCFDSQGHKSGVKLEYSDGHMTQYALLEWTNEVNNQIRVSHFDEKRATDFGAMGISVLLVCHLTDYTNIVSSTTNNGYDFELLKEDDNLNFISARLEISGIRKETPHNTVESRLKVKEKQILKNATIGTICYVSIIEFSKPKAKFIQK